MAISDDLSSKFTGEQVKALEKKKAASAKALSDLQTKGRPKDTGGMAGGIAAFKYDRDVRNTQAAIDSYSSQINNPTTLMSAREKDLVKGSQFGEAVVGDGLGRLGTDQKVQETLARFEDMSKGMDSQEMAARKSEAFQGIDQQQQTQSRALQAALARSGVKGGAAGAQQRELALGGLRAKAGVERDLLVSDYDRKSSGLKDFANMAGQVKQFDLSQAAAEKNIVLTAGLGYGQLGAAERGAKLAADAQRASAAASSGSCHIAGTLVEMEDSSYTKIEDLRIGDRLSEGVIKGIGQIIADEAIYEYKGEFMTASHNVEVNGVLRAVSTLEEAVITTLPYNTVVYPISVDTGIYRTMSGFISGDIYSEEGKCISEKQMMKIVK